MKLGVSLATLAVAVIAIAAGCGGDAATPAIQDQSPAAGPEPTLEEYFESLRAAAEQSEMRADALALETGLAEEDFASEQEALAVTQAFWQGYVAILRDYVQALEGIDAPAEAKSGHNDVVDALADMLDVMEGQAGELAQAESFVDAQAVLDDPAFLAADKRVAETCSALQDIADANEIAVRLDCEPILP